MATNQQTRVEPALTPDEWGELYVEGFSVSGGRLWNSADGQPVERPAALMALANASLPDGDPRKITRRDAVLAEVCGRYGGNEGWTLSGAHLDELLALARKLRALLPPE